MIIYKIAHLIFGYVCFVAQGGFAERFINICHSKGIPLWNVKKIDGSLTACTTATGYTSIRTPSKQSGMKVRLKSKHGLPFIIHRHKKRTGIIIGFAVFFVSLFLLSGHVWIIDVTGNTQTSSAIIEEAFENNGMVIGSRISKLNLSEIRINALNSLDTISWVSINIRGCTAEIKVRESSQTPHIEQNVGTSNIVAAKDGQIEIIEPYRGTAAVKPGQTVLAGDLLVSGVTESRLQTYLFSNANGYAVARTKIEISTAEQCTQKVLIPDTRKVYSIYFLGRELRLGISKDSEFCYKYEKRLYVGNKKLPFGIVYRLYSNFSEAEVKTSMAYTKLSALSKIAFESYNRTLHAQIISRKCDISEKNDKIIINEFFECYENICRRVPFEIEELPMPENEAESATNVGQ